MIIFKPKFAYGVLNGDKTLTRRLKREDDFLHRIGKYDAEVVDCTGRVRWRVGKKEAIIPGRTKKGIGYLRVTSLDLESLQAITPEDVIAEGIMLTEYAELAKTEPVKAFSLLWDEVNKHKPDEYKWDANPEVWRIGVTPYIDDPLWWWPVVEVQDGLKE